MKHMKITYYGTSASEAWPALFCNCMACELARLYGGKNIRTRSQSLIDESLLIDFSPDTNYHVQMMGLNLRKVKTLLLTHSHHDHFFPYDIFMRNPGFAEGLNESKMHVYGNETIKERLSEALEIIGGKGERVEFHLLQPFDMFRTEDGYLVTALLADHNQPEKSLMYTIEREGKQILYAHDTGYFPECTWEFIEGRKFDLVSLDCTALSRDWRTGHMGFASVDEVKERLKKMDCITDKTILVLNHLAHYGEFTHEKICEIENPKGYEVAYDGCSFEL